MEKDRIFDGSRTRTGDAIIGLASSGPHSNGYSLIRKLLTMGGATTSTELDDKPLTEFAFSSQVATGPAYWADHRELSAQTVHLTEGGHVLRVRFDVRAPFNFGGLKFEPVAAASRAAEHK